MKKSENTNLNDKPALAVIHELRKQLLKAQNGQCGKIAEINNFKIRFVFFKQKGQTFFRADISVELCIYIFLLCLNCDNFTNNQLLTTTKRALKGYIDNL